MSTPFADALSLCNLASVGIFGIVLSAAFCELEWTRQRKLLLAGCTVLESSCCMDELDRLLTPLESFLRTPRSFVVNM